MLAARTTRQHVHKSISNITPCIRLASIPAQRRGMNLVERHTRHSTPTEKVFHPVNQGHRRPPDTPVPKTFRGLKIPEKPFTPTPDDCCMSRCDICVYDVYLTSLRAYRRDILKLRSSLDASHVPREEWPAEVRIEVERDALDYQGEERAATEAVALRSRGLDEASNRWTREAWLETMKLIMWVLRGCKG